MFRFGKKFPPNRLAVGSAVAAQHADTQITRLATSCVAMAAHLSDAMRPTYTSSKLRRHYKRKLATGAHG